MKHFCDRCGQPAADNYQEAFVEGTGEHYGEKFNLRAIFELKRHLTGSGSVNREVSDPCDLCGECQVLLLERLAEKIKEQNK